MGSYFVPLEIYLRFMRASLAVQFRFRYRVVATSSCDLAQFRGASGESCRERWKTAGPEHVGVELAGRPRALRGAVPTLAELVFYSASSCPHRFVPSVRIWHRAGASSVAHNARGALS